MQESSADWNQLACRVLATDISEQPAGLTGGRLWPYQMQGLCWMAGLARHSLNGILADEMGLGKTVQVEYGGAAERDSRVRVSTTCVDSRTVIGRPLRRIMVLAAKPYLQVIALMMHLVEADAACLPFLIVVPASLVPNWQAELQRWAPGLKTVIYRGPAAEREDIYIRQVRLRRWWPGSERMNPVVLTISDSGPSASAGQDSHYTIHWACVSPASP